MQQHCCSCGTGIQAAQHVDVHQTLSAGPAWLHSTCACTVPRWPDIPGCPVDGSNAQHLCALAPRWHDVSEPPIDDIDTPCRDLTYWGFQQLAHPLNGIMTTEFRPVDCTTHQPLTFTPGFVNQTIYGDRVETGWAWFPYKQEADNFWAQARAPLSWEHPQHPHTCHIRLQCHRVEAGSFPRKTSTVAVSWHCSQGSAGGRVLEV